MKIKYLYILILYFSIPVMGSEMPIEAEISGKSFLYYQAACQEFERKGLSNLGDYKLVLINQGDYVVVLFDDPNRPKGRYGSSKNLRGFEVELSADFKVIKSYYSR